MKTERTQRGRDIRLPVGGRGSRTCRRRGKLHEPRGSTETDRLQPVKAVIGSQTNMIAKTPVGVLRGSETTER